MSSEGDSRGVSARAPKRSASGSSFEFCKTIECSAFGKALGIGYCRQCCDSRGTLFKGPKKMSKLLDNDGEIDVGGSASTYAEIVGKLKPDHFKEGSPVRKDLMSQRAAQVLVETSKNDQIPDEYFINKARESVKSVTFEDLLAWFSQKGVVGTDQCNCKEELVLLMARQALEYDVTVTIGSSPEPSPEANVVVLPVVNAAHIQELTEVPKSTPSRSSTDATAKTKIPSPNKELSMLQADTTRAFQTFDHRASVLHDTFGQPGYQLDVNYGKRSLFVNEDDDQSQTKTGTPQNPSHASESPFAGSLKNELQFLQMGIDVEARWISEEMGYGIFCINSLPGGSLDVNGKYNSTPVTTYSGHMVHSKTGEVLIECPKTQLSEKKYKKKWTRSRKWGPYEREHSVLLQHDSNVSIDGTYSSQPFLFTEAFHGGVGFAASCNAGASGACNMKKLQRRNPELPYDPNGVLDQVGCCLCTAFHNWTDINLHTGSVFRFDASRIGK